MNLVRWLKVFYSSLTIIGGGGYSTFAERKISTRWTIWTAIIMLRLIKKLQTVCMIRGSGVTRLLRSYVSWGSTRYDRAARRSDVDWLSEPAKPLPYARGEVRTHAAVTANRVRAPRAPPHPTPAPHPPVTSQSMPYIALII